eukprot:NODE_8382_length_1499_cov_7.191691.p1 GENE.NODE_8382_length_1499_cov_7.191691~~NODE_8382_length_1499_cov_7.191691.p1  ORF type:complete len:294 (+),score=39.03 NODE_8382_length_1499_cov_7.191691:57-938(+)
MCAAAQPSTSPPTSRIRGQSPSEATSTRRHGAILAMSCRRKASDFMSSPRTNAGRPAFFDKSSLPSMMASEEGSHDTPFTFHETNKAPEVPLDPLFKLEATTLEAYMSAAELGNRFISMLAAERDVSIIKLNHAKMSIKAEARRPMPYMFKARIYRKGERHHAVMLQRCCGDAASFRQLFSCAQRFLETPLCPSTQPAISQPGFFDMPLPNDLPHEQPLLQPLLDMAAPDAHPLLETEAAVAFANIAAQPSCVKALCTPEAFAVLHVFLSNGLFRGRQFLAGPTGCQRRKRHV